MANEPPGSGRNGNGIGTGNGYRGARIGAALALTAVLALLLVLDALSPDYDVNYLTLTALLAAIAGLLGVEVLATLFGRKP